jgi:hypothetical protein
MSIPDDDLHGQSAAENHPMTVQKNLSMDHMPFSMNPCLFLRQERLVSRDEEKIGTQWCQPHPPPQNQWHRLVLLKSLIDTLNMQNMSQWFAYLSIFALIMFIDSSFESFYVLFSFVL